MKFKFSIRRLFIITTVIAVILAIADRMGLFSGYNPALIIIVVYSSVYALLFGIFLMPRYRRQWNEYCEVKRALEFTRVRLEKEVEKKIVARKGSIAEDEPVQWNAEA
ncbi:MAG: hypothetical protein AB8B55_02055 [Mariniblastus sp.]